MSGYGPFVPGMKARDIIPDAQEFLLIHREPDEMMVKRLPRMLLNEKFNPAPPESLSPFNNVVYPHSVGHRTRHVVIFWVF